MTKLVGLVALLLALVFASTAAATHPKVKVCHKGKTLTVDSHALKGHLGHGDKAGACAPTPPGGGGGGNGGGGDTPVTPGTFAQVNRILACADRVVLRHSDGSYGISVDLDLPTFESGFYGAARFTVARFYTGVGATCDKLGGAPTGDFVYGYPVWK